ncbi:MarR family transcriptional regulator [Paenibacillus sonchi]|uniref:MarR family transcriptional regulator n=1 Tax=Paenibacillus sonchi TaxID=373687 RepID=A0A974SCR4_9BACL|nr:MarR family transcriptional regulator [Paenibacillus sonchi]QQZ60491.1 MarR family transcriptional regulator [Paenibacillus sonchi]
MELLTLARNVGILHRQTQTYIAAIGSTLDISFSECILLMNIYGNEGITQEELSALLFIDKAATARSLQSLEKKGVIRRETKNEDRRAKKLFVTDKGTEFQAYFFNRLEAWEKVTTGGMDEEAKDQVFKGLKRMAEQSMRADLSDCQQSKEEGHKYAIEPETE